MNDSSVEHDHDDDRDHDHRRNAANDNGGAMRPPPSTGGVLASAALTALGAVFNNVDTTSVGGRSGMPMLQFKTRRATAPGCSGSGKPSSEDDSRWAVNPTSFKWG